MNFSPDDLVKSCYRLESGLRLGIEGIHACQLGQFSSPIFWMADEAASIKITKELIAEKREWLFSLLNDKSSDIPCKNCSMVTTKHYRDVNFTRLGQIDFAPTTTCNLRCNFCSYTKDNTFYESKYDPLAILKEFKAEDVEWNAAVDFNGGEPALLRDFDEYVDYYSSRRIRVFLYTNAVKFRQSIYDGLMNGTIRCVCTSLDAGSPSSFKNLKGRDYFVQTLENLTRYAHAGSFGKGMLVVKYIFCEENCTDDDIVGFTYAMLAIRPQNIWLTFDFGPLQGLSGDEAGFGGYDYSRLIDAYVKMYCLLKKHGLEPVHYAEKHLAMVSKQGRLLLDNVLSEISKCNISNDKDLQLKDFRRDEKDTYVQYNTYFKTNPLRIKESDQNFMELSLSGKRLVIVPTSPVTRDLLNDKDINNAEIVGFIDRDTVLHGKYIEGIRVYGYESISELNPDIIIVAPPRQHQIDILQAIARFSNENNKVLIYDQSGSC